MQHAPTPFPIPVRSLLPEPADAVDYMPMPREMSTFSMPRLPEPGLGSDLAGAHAVLTLFLAHMDAWLAAGRAHPMATPPVLDLAGLPAATLRVINETLGEGEVSAIVDAAHEVRVQETVFSGVWREQHLRGSHLLHDHLLAAPIPPIVAALAHQRAATTLRSLPLPAGAMNVPALLHELQEAMDRSSPHTPPHVLNLTLLPLSPEDGAHLDAVLSGGSVVLLSRGFGNCRISSTAARNVWRVQYFNTMNTLILDTIEVVPMPEVALAAPEDITETRGRLAELLQWMGESVTSA
jgi:hydrogenase-1 operon protein HyaF